MRRRNKEIPLKQGTGRKNQRVAIAGICLLCGGLVFVLSTMLGYFTDDWHFRFVFNGFMPDGNEQRVKGLGDIILSMKNYYRLSGGRVLAHALVYGILMLPKWIYNVLNACIFVSVGYLIQRLCKGKEEALSTGLVFLLLFLCLPSFGDTTLWISGSVNYLWMSLFPLLFLNFLRKEMFWPGVCAGFVCGFTNEATAGILMIFLLSDLWLKKKKIGIRECVQMAGLLPGTLFVLTAPGNYNRAQVVNETKIFSAEVTLKMLGRTLEWLIKGPYSVLILIMLCLTFLFWKRKERFAGVIPYLTAAAAGMAALALSGTFLKRAHYLNVILLITAFVKMIMISRECFIQDREEIEKKLEKVLPADRLLRYCRATGYVAVLLIAVYMGFQIWCFAGATAGDRARNRIIQEAARKGEAVTVSRNIHYTAGVFYPEEGAVSKEYEALWMGLYYGIKINLLF